MVFLDLEDAVAPADKTEAIWELVVRTPLGGVWMIDEASQTLAAQVAARGRAAGMHPS